MTNHTKYENQPTGFSDPAQVAKWIQENLNVTQTSISVQLNYDYTIRKLEIGKSLSNADKKKLIEKFPELEDKEI